MESVTVSDYEWLVSDAGAEWLRQLAQAEGSLVSLAGRLRDKLSPARTHLVIEQVELRRRAEKKFSQAAEMFFTTIGLQQSTDEWIAGHKAARYRVGEPVVDLCCGIGGDLLALAGRGPAAGMERDEELAVLARANACVSGAKAVEVVHGDVAGRDLSLFYGWHIDPDRRAKGFRTTTIQRYEPGLDVIEQLLETNTQGAVKLAPATVAPERWQSDAELEWISRHGECRQQVAWFGELTRHAGSRTATQLQPDGAAHSVTGAAGVQLPVAGAIGRYLYEPDPAVLAAHLTGYLAALHHLSGAAAGIVYLTADTRVDDALLHVFEVSEVLPFDRRRVKALLRDRGIGHLEVKMRGVQIDPAREARRLRVPGQQFATLLLLPKQGSTIAVLARRVQGAGHSA